MGLFDKLFGDKNQPTTTPTIKHQEEWDSYLTMVDDKIGSIMLDLGLKKVSPFTDKPNLIWISVNMNDPREDGLSSAEEADMLYKIEDALVERLSAKYKGIFIGRLTSNGHRDMYIYAGDSTLYDKTISEIMVAFPNYEYDFGTKEDPEWTVYHEFLYPIPEQFQSMMNRRVLMNLEKNEDNHDLPRLVDHYLYFKSTADKQAFIESIDNTGFTVEQENPEVRLDGLIALHLTIVSPIDQGTIDDCTIDLLNRAKQFNGEYDGWGCPIVK